MEFPRWDRGQPRAVSQSCRWPHCGRTCCRTGATSANRTPSTGCTWRKRCPPCQRNWQTASAAGRLLPEFWQQKSEKKEVGQRPSGNRRKRPITSLNAWIQCFAVYVGVLSRKYPEAVPELLAYMVAVVRASEDYAGTA